MKSCQILGNGARRATGSFRSAGDTTAQRIDVRSLWRNELFEILTTCWDRERHAANCLAHAPMAALEFMQSGCYVKYGRSGRQWVDANRAAWFWAGEDFEVVHPAGPENRGVTIRLSARALDGLQDDLVLAARCREKQGPAIEPLCTPAPLHLEQHRLVQLARRGRVAADAMEISERVALLLRGALNLLFKTPDSRTSATRRTCGGLQRDMDRVMAVQELIAARWDERLSLSELAGAADCSIWHLAEVFRARAGMPIHRYLKRVRLRHALCRMADHPRDLTGVAMACGFDSHSHFSAAFKAEFGRTPSSVT